MASTRRQTQEFESIMETLLYNKRIEVPYRKILKLLDRENWTNRAWDEIKQIYESIGRDSGNLRYCFFFNEILFISTAELRSHV